MSRRPRRWSAGAPPPPTCRRAIADLAPCRLALRRRQTTSGIPRRDRNRGRRACAVVSRSRRMRPMRKILIASLLLGLAACGKGGGLEKEMKGWKDKVCKCTDKACADKTWEEYRAWQKTKRDAAKDMPKDQVEKLVAVEDEAKACRNKFNTEG